MTPIIVADYREMYEVDENDTITTLGKFENEHISVAYFWDAALNGDCETSFDGDTTFYFMTIGQSDLESFPDLKDRYGVCLYETESGFVNAVWFFSEHEYAAAFEAPIY